MADQKPNQPAKPASAETSGISLKHVEDVVMDTGSKFSHSVVSAVEEMMAGASAGGIGAKLSELAQTIRDAKVLEPIINFPKTIKDDIDKMF